MLKQELRARFQAELQEPKYIPLASIILNRILNRIFLPDSFARSDPIVWSRSVLRIIGQFQIADVPKILSVNRCQFGVINYRGSGDQCVR